MNQLPYHIVEYILRYIQVEAASLERPTDSYGYFVRDPERKIVRVFDMYTDLYFGPFHAKKQFIKGAEQVTIMEDSVYDERRLNSSIQTIKASCRVKRIQVVFVSLCIDRDIDEILEWSRKMSRSFRITQSNGSDDSPIVHEICIWSTINPYEYAHVLQKIFEADIQNLFIDNLYIYISDMFILDPIDHVLQNKHVREISYILLDYPNDQNKKMEALHQLKTYQRKITRVDTLCLSEPFKQDLHSSQDEFWTLVRSINNE